MLYQVVDNEGNVLAKRLSLYQAVETVAKFALHSIICYFQPERMPQQFK